MDEWAINRPLGQCCATGKKIEGGQKYYAALVETEQGLQRQDFCSEYWLANKPKVFCYWKTKLQEPGQKKQLLIDDDMLMAFFERLANETEQERVSFRFVLALVLMRRRRLKYNSVKMDGDREVWHLRVAGDSRMVEVVNPQLDEKQIGQLTSQIGQILRADL